jgi:hypothetical protein
MRVSCRECTFQGHSGISHNISERTRWSEATVYLVQYIWIRAQKYDYQIASFRLFYSSSYNHGQLRACLEILPSIRNNCARPPPRYRSSGRESNMSEPLHRSHLSDGIEELFQGYYFSGNSSWAIFDGGWRTDERVRSNMTFGWRTGAFHRSRDGLRKFLRKRHTGVV